MRLKVCFPWPFLCKLSLFWCNRADKKISDRFFLLLAKTYPRYPNNDIGFPVDYPWSDVGSWTALADGLLGDATGNAARGLVQAIDSDNNVLVSTGPVLSVVGVDNLVVVATPDAVLVVPKDQAQRVREVVEALHEKGWDDVL